MLVSDVMDLHLFILKFCIGILRGFCVYVVFTVVRAVDPH